MYDHGEKTDPLSMSLALQTHVAKYNFLTLQVHYCLTVFLEDSFPLFP